MEQYLEFKNITKLFPGVVALDDISFRADGGKVVALLGENGAGKSTLLKIMSGDLKADQGQLFLNGEELHLADPHAAIKKGISVIYQERQLIYSQSVMENIYLGDLPIKMGQVDFKALKKGAREIIESFGLDIDPEAKVGELSIAYQQMVEIMKAYRRDSIVIAFDEPTAPLTDTEIDILFNLIQKLKERGKIVLYVSHRLKEIFQITDEIVILKDGKYVKTLVTKDTSEPELIQAMVGRDIGDTYANLIRNDKMGEVLLDVQNPTTPFIHDVTFQLRRGEIIGLAGLVGAGRTEVGRALYGADPILSGSFSFEGKKCEFKSPRDAIDAGIALCPEDRKLQGLILWRSIKDNVCVPILEKVRKGLFLDNKLENDITIGAINKYNIRTPTTEKQVIELSGGNQQKVILGRCTTDAIGTKLLILDEPTKSIDVSTKAEIYQMVCDFARQGYGVIFISSELTEVINIADTILVMHNGHITGKVSREEATEENVLALAMLE